MSRNALTPTPKNSFTLRSSRSRLLAGVFTLALAGGALGAIVVPEAVTPAAAQLSTNQPAGTFSFADIVEKVSPAVVSVKVKKDEDQVAANDDEDGPGSQNIPPQIERFMRRFGFGPGGPGGPGARAWARAAASTAPWSARVPASSSPPTAMS